MPTPAARPLTLVLALLLLGACKIERTPREFIDRSAPGGERTGVLERMLEERLGEMSAALRRGDAADAAAALHPTPDVMVVGGGPASGTAALVAELQGVGETDGDPVITAWGALPEPNPGFLWFAAELPGRGAATGFYTRDGVEWRLALFHLTPPGE